MKYDVVMIYSDGCPKCQEMRELIDKCIGKSGLTVSYHNCEDPESLDVALDYNISDIPGCCIGGIVVVEGERFSGRKIKGAIKDLIG
jgi:hypothetical protein